MAENWLALAPKPPPLAPGKLWHVYISYRSVNRSWALALYDVLNELGYKTFLDQYVLTAAAPLAVSLGEALDASQSAILVWSSRYEDSEWLQDQFATLELLQNAKKGFRYVVARVTNFGSTSPNSQKVRLARDCSPCSAAYKGFRCGKISSVTCWPVLMALRLSKISSSRSLTRT